MKIIKLILLSLLFLLFQNMLAQDPAAIDPSFIYTSGANTNVKVCKLQVDNKIIVAGAFTAYNGPTTNQIMRLYPSGAKDPSFDSGTGVSGGFIKVVDIQSDGKILIGGNFTTYNGTPTNNIARLNSNGTIDTTFQTGLGANTDVLTINVLPSGKILICGYFTSYDGTAVNRIARLNADGSLDTSFLIGTGIEGTGSWIGILTSIVQPDGKIVLGGNFDSYNGTICSHLTRLNSNGTVDAFFLSGLTTLVGGGNVTSSVLQPDGKIIIGGPFTSYNGTGIQRLARIQSNGFLDNSFTATSGPDMSVYEMALQQDGKLLIGGAFTLYNNLPSNGLARLNQDRTVDNTFNVGTGLNGTGQINKITIQPDGKIIIGGYFTHYNGTTRYMIARLNGGNLPIGVAENHHTPVKLFPNPTTGSIDIYLGEEKYNVNLRLTNSIGQVVLAKDYNPTNHIYLDIDAPKGIYFLQIESNGENITRKIIKE